MTAFICNMSMFFGGLLTGSFIGVCIYRIPQGQSVVLGLSFCDNCKASLRWPYKFPILGYLLLRGRSRCCKQPIPSRYLVLEIVSGVLFLLLFWHFGSDIRLFSAILLGALLTIATFIDLSHRIIPDKITLTGILSGLLLAGAGPSHDLAGALTGTAVCGGFLYLGGWLGEVLFKKPDAMGGGDIKLAAMIGAFLGWQAGLLAVTVAAFAGTVAGLVQILVKGYSAATRKVPFGPFLALGALVVLLWERELLMWCFSLSE
ncbi:MAG: prepilin peptidase [bacterium]